MSRGKHTFDGWDAALAISGAIVLVAAGIGIVAGIVAIVERMTT